LSSAAALSGCPRRHRSAGQAPQSAGCRRCAADAAQAVTGEPRGPGASRQVARRHRGLPAACPEGVNGAARLQQQPGLVLGQLESRVVASYGFRPETSRPSGTGGIDMFTLKLGDAVQVSDKRESNRGSAATAEKTLRRDGRLCREARNRAQGDTPHPCGATNCLHLCRGFGGPARMTVTGRVTPPGDIGRRPKWALRLEPCRGYRSLKTTTDNLCKPGNLLQQVLWGRRQI